MTEMYAPYSRYYVLHAHDCPVFDSFSCDVRGAQAWRSPWFNTARRFFLYGAAKELEVDFGVVDRIVDYMIALEAALVPEQDFVGRRLRERAVALIKGTAEAKSVLSKLYDVRSTIVHGSMLSKKQYTILKDHLGAFELSVRQILVQSVKTLCVQEKDRTAQLKRIYDISDSERVERLRQSVHEIQGESLKSALVSCLSRFAIDV